jgi:hypothetical protein
MVLPFGSSSALVAIVLFLFISRILKACDACELVTPRLRCDEHSSKSSLSCGTKVIEPVGERNKLPKVDAS